MFCLGDEKLIYRPEMTGYFRRIWFKMTYSIVIFLLQGLMFKRLVSGSGVEPVSWISIPV